MAKMKKGEAKELSVPQSWTCVHSLEIENDGGLATKKAPLQSLGPLPLVRTWGIVSWDSGPVLVSS